MPSKENLNDKKRETQEKQFARENIELNERVIERAAQEAVSEIDNEKEKFSNESEQLNVKDDPEIKNLEEEAKESADKSKNLINVVVKGTNVNISMENVGKDEEEQDKEDLRLGLELLKKIKEGKGDQAGVKKVEKMAEGFNFDKVAEEVSQEIQEDKNEVLMGWQLLGFQKKFTGDNEAAEKYFNMAKGFDFNNLSPEQQKDFRTRMTQIESGQPDNENVEVKETKEAEEMPEKKSSIVSSKRAGVAIKFGQKESPSRVEPLEVENDSVEIFPNDQIRSEMIEENKDEKQPELEKSDLSDKEIEEKQIKESINKAANFVELFSALNSIKGIDSSVGFKASQYWKDKINAIRSGQGSFTEITSNMGLRQKVIELFNNEIVPADQPGINAVEGDKTIENAEQIISGAVTYAQLFKTLDSIGGLQSSQGYKDSEFLKQRIKDVLFGKYPINYVTSAGGLRKKVQELINSGQAYQG